MNDLPAELRGKTKDELRFWRLIDERIPSEDGSEEMVLACGHRITCIIPYPSKRQYSYCPQCVNAWVEAEKNKKQS